MPQVMPANAISPAHMAPGPSSHRTANDTHAVNPSTAVKLPYDAASSAIDPSTQRVGSHLNRSSAEATVHRPKVASSMAAGNPTDGLNPQSLGYDQQHAFSHGIGGAMGGSGGGATGPYKAGGTRDSAYDSSIEQLRREGSIYGMGGNPMGSMYGMGGNPMGSMYGMGGMGGNPMGSMYGMGGMGGPMGSMYGMGGNPMGSMYGMGGNPMGSMYGMGGNPMGSMYGMGGPMGSMYGMGGFGGSLYGGSLNNATGSFYGTGGLLYGSNDSQAVYGSIYGSRTGSMFGGFNSVYQHDVPHTRLGVVRKQSIPGFSYSFTSNLGSVAYQPSINDDQEPESADQKKRQNTFHLSTSMVSTEDAVESKVTDKQEAPQKGDSSDANKGEKVIANDAKADTASAAGKGAAKSKSIAKKQEPVTEAPKTPATLREQRNGDASSQAPTLSSDFRIHNVAVVEQTGSGSVVVTKNGDTCVVNGKSYPMDEVLVYTPADNRAAIESFQLQNLIEHVLAGHNTAILLDDDGEATVAGQMVLQDTMTKLMEEIQKPARNSYAGLSMSICSLQSKTAARDLLDGDDAPRSLGVGSSPLFGPVVMGLKSETIESGADFAKLYNTALKRGAKEAMIVCVVVIKQMRPASGEGKGEVFLSSVFIGVSREGPKAFHGIIDKSPTSVQEVFRYAIDGPTVCVHIVAVRQDMASEEVLEAAAKIGSVHNSAARSGNVRRFIDFTEEQLKGMMKRRDASTGPERAELDNHVKRLAVVHEDAKNLLSDPKGTEPKVYQVEIGRGTRTTPGEIKTSVPVDSTVSTAVKDESSAAAEDKPRSTNVATLVIADAAESRAYSLKSTTLTVSGRPFVVDEVVMRDTIKPGVMDTKATGRVLAAFLKGYNGAVIAVDSAAVAANGMESPTMGFVFSAVADALQNPTCKGVRVSIALLRASGVACDLVGSATELKPVEVSSSPLFGPILHNAVLHPVHSTEDLNRLVDEARGHVKTLWDAQSAVHVTVVHCFSKGDDVYVSSLLVSFSSASSTIYEQVLQRQAHAGHDLFRYAFGGAATTAYVVSVSKADPVADVLSSLGTQHTASIVQNRAPRQGSIKNLISYTKALLEKRRERLASLPDDSSEKKSMMMFIPPMERMLSDHEKAMADPTNHFPYAYAVENDSEKRTQEGVPAAAAAAVVTPGEAKSPTGDESGGLPKADKTPKSPEKDNAEISPGTLGETLSSAFMEPRVVALVVSDVGAGAKQLSLGKQDYILDEIVKRIKHPSSITTIGPSASVAEVEERFAEVRNCSLISASSVKDVPSTEEPVWVYFHQFLNNALAGGKPGEKMFVDLHFAVVSADELVADLLSDEGNAESKHLEITSSPIYGPRIYNASAASAQNADEVARVLSRAHTNAERHLAQVRTGDLMMVGTAVLRRRTIENDVLVASLMGTLTGLSVKAYKEVMDKAPVARRLLLSSAYGGPSATITIVNVGAEDESAQGMVSTAVSLSKRQRNLVSRTGSVKAFLRYTEGTMKREQARAESASGEEKERYMQKVNRLKPVVEDHKRLLQDFNSRIPAYTVGRPSSSTVPRLDIDDTQGTNGSLKTLQQEPQPETSEKTPAAVQANKEALGPNRIQTVVVVTKNDKTPSSTATVPVTLVDEKHITVHVAGAQRTIEFDEVVRRKDASSEVSSDRLNAVVRQFVGGFNAAFLCCDVAGSTAGTTACTYLAQKIFEKKSEKSEVYMSIVAVKDGNAAKDLLTPLGSGGYAPMHLRKSLIFGPWLHEATMVKIARVAQFGDVFSAAYAETAKDGTVCVVSLVLKAIDERDVIVSSLLMSLSSPVDAHAAAVKALPETDRKLYQYAVHGSCFTVGFLGLLDAVDGTGLQECVEVYEKMRMIENPSLRHGSVRRFLNSSIKAAADAKLRVERVTDERERPVYEQRLALLEKMVADARELIDSPEGRIPNTYI